MSLFQLNIENIKEYIDDNGDVITTLNDIVVDEQEQQLLRKLRLRPEDLLWI